MKIKLKELREEKLEPDNWLDLKKQIEEFREGFDKYQYPNFKKITEFNLKSSMEYGWKNLVHISSDFDVKNVEDLYLISNLFNILEQKGKIISKTINGKKNMEKKIRTHNFLLLILVIEEQES